MTISTTTAKSRYAGDGATTSFPTGFKFVDNDHVRVFLRAADGNETLWTEGSEYDLSGAGAPGGGTVMVSTNPVNHTPAAGEILVVKLAVPPRQETSLPLGGAFPSTAVEGMADLAALRDQQIEEALSRTVKFKETTALADVEFPEPEAGKSIRWNAAGDGLESAALPAWLSGAGAPVGGDGNPGDFYLDGVAADVYEKTGVNTWTLRVNIEGPQGVPGTDGADGADGQDGIGVIVGGGIGQVLRKASNADYDTEWGSPGAAPVDSVFGRIGAVAAEAGDYNAGQIGETAAAKIMTAAERTKLADVAAGAEVNPPVPSQAQAEDGANTTEYSWTPQRVHQAAKRAVAAGTVQVFDSSGTWSKPSDCRAVRVRLVGGGGGGGGSGPGDNRTGGGGGAGGYVEKLFDVTSISSATISVGTAGSAGSTTGNGGSGGATSWSDGTNTLTGGGGGGGNQGQTDSATRAVGGSASGGDINIAGQSGGIDGGSSATFGPYGEGGSNPLGNGGRAGRNAAGVSATGYGAGGAGGSRISSTSRAGGAGRQGVVIVEELY
jgi:hypothetical protein